MNRSGTQVAKSSFVTEQISHLAVKCVKRHKKQHCQTVGNEVEKSTNFAINKKIILVNKHFAPSSNAAQLQSYYPFIRSEDQRLRQTTPFLTAERDQPRNNPPTTRKNKQQSLDTSTTEKKMNNAMDWSNKGEPSQAQFQKKFKGNNPNIQWRAVSENYLINNCDGRFIPLEDDGNYEEEMKIIEKYKSLGEDTKEAVKFPKPSYLYKQRTGPWLFLRSKRITASKFKDILGFGEPESAEILGLNFGTHADSVMEYERMRTFLPKSIRREEEPSIVKEKFGDLAMIRMGWGTEHEPNAIATLMKAYDDMYVMETGLWTSKITFNNSDDILRLGASPDGLIYVNGEKQPSELLEAKCGCPFFWNESARVYYYRKREPFDVVPCYYIPQIQGQLAICRQILPSLKRTKFTTWTCGGCNVFHVEYNQEYCDLMFRFLARFQSEFVRRGVEPPLNFYHDEKHPMHDDYMKLLRMTLHISRNSVMVKRILPKGIVQKETAPKKKKKNAPETTWDAPPVTFGTIVLGEYSQIFHEDKEEDTAMLEESEERRVIGSLLEGETLTCAASSSSSSSSATTTAPQKKVTISKQRNRKTDSIECKLVVKVPNDIISDIIGKSTKSKARTFGDSTIFDNVSCEAGEDDSEEFWNESQVQMEQISPLTPTKKARTTKSRNK